MKAIEFKSKISKNRILIPKEIQPELQDAVDKNVRVMILFDDSDDLGIPSYTMEEQSIDSRTEELESINRGLNDFKEGKIHSHETARKLYEKYL